MCGGRQPASSVVASTESRGSFDQLERQVLAKCGSPAGEEKGSDGQLMQFLFFFYDRPPPPTKRQNTEENRHPFRIHVRFPAKSTFYFQLSPTGAKPRAPHHQREDVSPAQEFRRPAGQTSRRNTNTSDRRRRREAKRGRGTLGWGRGWGRGRLQLSASSADDRRTGTAGLGGADPRTRQPGDRCCRSLRTI